MTSDEGSRLASEEIEDFLVGRPTYAFEPSTRRRVASVTYHSDGTCRTEFEAGGGDVGEWGIESCTYWTRYKAFRDGSKNVFFLKWVSRDVAQAYFENGTPAFLQSGQSALSEADRDIT